MKITIWVGPSPRPWGPSSLATGVGGSETAVVWMSRELARLGHQVDVLGGAPEGREYCDGGGRFGGVRWTSADRLWNAAEEVSDSDVLISWRDKQLPRRFETIGRPIPERTKKILWMHDAHVGSDWERDMESFDEVWVLSNWARGEFLRRYPHVRAEKTWKTSNGIDPTRFSDEKLAASRARAEGSPPNFVWSSSPDRGLDVLLDMWPEVRRVAGGSATLDVCYGFDGFAPDERTRRWKSDLMNKMIRLNGLGVRYHGRVGQDALADLMMTSPLWLYPTTFGETFCITALEAQAAGAVPAVSTLGALREKAALGAFVHGNVGSNTFRKNFLHTVEGLMEDTDRRKQMSSACREWAMKQTWTAVAESWSEHLGEMLR